MSGSSRLLANLRALGTTVSTSMIFSAAGRTRVLGPAALNVRETRCVEGSGGGGGGSARAISRATSRSAEIAAP
jgi:hypothetical protein